MSQYEPAARATAEWWADQVFGKRSPARIGPHDDRVSGDTMAMMSLLPEAPKPAADKREDYVKAVTAKVETALGYNGHTTVLTDMGSPDEFRSIDQQFRTGGRYPMKTMSSTSVDHLVVYVGYHGEPQIIWHAEDWDRPACGQGQWDLSKPDGGRLPFKCSAPKYHPHNSHVMDTPDPLCTAPDPYREGRLCNKSADDYHHNENPEEYLARWSHAFQSGEVAVR